MAQDMIAHYQNVADLGVGGYSRVKLAIDTRSNTYVAVKILLSEPKTDSVTKQTKWVMTDSKVKQCKREIALMEKIAHKNVVALHDVVEDATFPQLDKDTNQSIPTPCLCVVLEYCSRGELFDFLMYTGRLGERATRTYFIQFLDGLKAMHESGYAHRDLKPENLLLSADFTLKIADFGFATEFKDTNGKIRMATTCGTKGYSAPELLLGQKYTHKVDLFAVGIIMFTTFAGFPPFQHAGQGDWWWDKMNKAWTYWNDSIKTANAIESKERAKKGTEKMRLFWAAHERSLPFEDNFKDLMQNLLNPYPAQRYDIEDCFKHQWIKKGKTYSRKQLQKYMTKFVNTVNAQRAIKIQKQLKDQGMDSQQDQAKKNRFKHRVVETLDSSNLARFEKLTAEFETKLAEIDENDALLNKVRFKFESVHPLINVLVALDVVVRQSQAEIVIDTDKCELRIAAGVSREVKNGTGVEDVSLMIKVYRAQFDTFDGIVSDDFIDVDADMDDDSDDDTVDDEKDSNDSNDSNDKSEPAKVQKPPNDNGNDKEKRWAVLFYRTDGSADGFQKLMAQIFYHPDVISVMDVSRFLPKSQAKRAELEQRVENARAFMDVFKEPDMPASNPQVVDIAA